MVCAMFAGYGKSHTPKILNNQVNHFWRYQQTAFLTNYLEKNKCLKIFTFLCLPENKFSLNFLSGVNVFTFLGNQFNRISLSQGHKISTCRIKECTLKNSWCCNIYEVGLCIYSSFKLCSLFRENISCALFNSIIFYT